MLLIIQWMVKLHDITDGHKFGPLFEPNVISDDDDGNKSNNNFFTLAQHHKYVGEW